MRSTIPAIMISLFAAQFQFSQWQQDLRLTTNSGTSMTSMNNARNVSADAFNVFAVWEDQRDGNSEIYVKRSTDRGTTWSADTRLTNNTAESLRPSVMSYGIYVHIVWYDNRDGNEEIYYKRSTDAGVSWSQDTRLTINPYNSVFPSLSVSISTVHVVWHDFREGNFEIYYKRSTDAGASWGPDVRLSNDPGYSIFASVSSADFAVDVVWTDDRGGNDEIYHKRSVTYGSSWGNETRITNNEAFSFSPSVSSAGYVTHIVWIDTRDGNEEIYYKRWAYSGWGSEIRLTNNGAPSYNPSVSDYASIVHVVWHDYRDGNYEIYHKSSSNAGLNWGSDSRLTNNSADSEAPTVAVDFNYLHCVWWDNRDGNTEIYYKRNPTGKPVPVYQAEFRRNNINKNLEDGLTTIDSFRTGFRSSTTYSILDLNVRIDTVLHSSDSDLEFYLNHNGIRDTLIYQAGGNGDNFIGTVLNDSAFQPVSSGTAPFTGTFRPHGQAFRI